MTKVPALAAPPGDSIETDRVSEGASLTAISTIYVSLDGKRMPIRTNAAEVAAFVSETFGHMLGNSSESEVPGIELMTVSDGCTLQTQGLVRYPDTSVEELLPLLKDEIRIALMRSRPDLLWLHAGAVSRNDRALLLCAPSGMGKSTLTTLLCADGWKYLSDDVAPVRMLSDSVIPFPQVPVRRIHPGTDVAPEAARFLERETVPIGKAAVGVECSIGAIVFIRYEIGAHESVTPLERGTGALELLRNLTNFMDHGDHAVARAAELARRHQLFQLTYSNPRRAADLLLRLE